MPKYIMLMGTSSHVGKSVLTTALCRIFYRQGKRVAPFKAQNMALNSYVTLDGKEMGRAQVAQAEAAGLAPQVDMNPVLLKPTGNAHSQVIIHGKPIGNMSAKEYHQGYSLKAFSAVEESLARLAGDYEIIVIEGAGSPAEINLKANDIVNMRVAKYLQTPVLLIADIDRGGALASLVGTLELLEEDERALVKGLVINKFRGDVSLLMPAVEFLQQKTGKPVLGIIPHIEKLGIDDEDSVSLEEKTRDDNLSEIKIAVIRTPKLSNFTDFDALASEPDVDLYYVQSVAELGQPDMIILPGSKNTTEDLRFVRDVGLEAAVKKSVASGIPVWGICGGYQMLGEMIYDPQHTESAADEMAGMGLLPLTTTFVSDKKLQQVKGEAKEFVFAGQKITEREIFGYEIHMGKTAFNNNERAVRHPFKVAEHGKVQATTFDGYVREDGFVVGTYIHGIFDADDFRRELLNVLRARKKLPPLPVSYRYMEEKERAYNRLADIVEQNLDLAKLAAIMGEQ